MIEYTAKAHPDYPGSTILTMDDGTERVVDVPIDEFMASARRLEGAGGVVIAKPAPVPIWQDPVNHQPQTCVHCKLRYAVERSISTGDAVPAAVFRALVAVTADFLAHDDGSPEALVDAFYAKLKDEIVLAKAAIEERRDG